MSAPDTAAPPRPASTGPASPAPPAGTGFRASLRVAHLVHRGTVRTTGILLLLASAVVLGLYLWQRLAPDRDRCRGFYRDGFAPDQLDAYTACSEATLGYAAASTWYGLLMDPGLWLFVPVLCAAAFAAGPLVARELESGTFRLAWTQAETPRRWLTGRLALFAVVAVVTGAVLVGLFRFTRATHVEPPLDWSRLGIAHALGPVLVAYLLLALAVGALTGLLLRRVLPAMAVAALATGGLLALLHRLRPGLWPTESAEWRFGAWPLPGHASVVDEGLLTSAGERVPNPDRWGLCTRDWDRRYECLRENGYVGEWVEYHPASHLWPLQLVETALVLGVAAVLVLLALRALRRLAP